jgi:hypothetical protein
MVRETWNRFGPFDAVLAHSFGGLSICLYLDQHPPEQRPQIALIAPATETTTAVNSFFKVLQMNDEIKQEFNRQIHQRTGRWPSEFSITRVAPTLKADIFWFHDQEDDMTPLADTEKIRAQNLPHIRFRITKGLGHRRIYRDNHVSREILDFFETFPAPEGPSRP